MAEVLIPPWVLPESPEAIRWIDDATTIFPPAFGRGFTQRGSWADPRWGLRRRYRGLRSDQLAAIRHCLNESRGQLNRILVTPHTPLSGNFPTSELLTNNTFANGTTGWEGYNSHNDIAVSDRIARATMTVNESIGINNTSSVALSQGVPYVARAFVSPGRGVAPGSQVIIGTTKGGSANGGTDASLTSYGMRSFAFAPSAAASYFVFGGAAASSTAGYLAGDYCSIPYMSLSRCALVDNGPNSLLRSDEFDNATWSKARLTITAGSTTDPIGTTTADALIEDTSNNTHLIAQTVTVSSSATDVMFGCAFKAATRTFVQLLLAENTGNTTTSCYFNLSTGASGTTATGVNWSNLRTFVVPLGNSWYACYLVARKTNAATSLDARIHIASADGTNSYLGNGSGLHAWRATLSFSSVPARFVQTTSATTSGSSQTGSALYLKGLPASTNGLLEVGDWFEVAGQLKQTTARLNSDAAGLGYLQFRPALGDSPADNDPVIINQPFGRFIYSGQQKELENMFGIYGDIEMELEEVYT